MNGVIMSRSFAIWGCRNYGDGSGDTYNETRSDFINELHINFWNITSQKFYYLDFGISFSHPETKEISEHGAVCLFLPFVKDKNDFTDLSTNLESSKELITAVFNEHVIKKDSINEKHLLLNLTRKGELLVNTKLDFEGGALDKRITTKKRNDGTYIFFHLKDCLSKSNHCNHYIRFRINLNASDIEKIVKTFYPKDLFLKSNIERSDIIDFRINEQRNLPNEVATTLASASCTPSKYHFFVIRDMVDDSSASGSAYQGCRILESETWKKYFSNDVSFGENDPIIYHWKIKKDEDARLGDFSAVVKFKTTRSKVSKIFAYIFYAAAITYIMKFIPVDGAHKNIYLLCTLAFIAAYIAIHLFTFKNLAKLIVWVKKWKT